MKINYFALIAVYAMFLALGMPDGAFGVAWPIIRYEMGLPLEIASVLIVVHSIFYSLAGRTTGRVGSVFGTENLSAAGLGVMMLGMGTFVFAPSFLWLVIATVFLGMGMGVTDSGLNAYAASNFAAKHMNWVHGFWGMGGMVSPIIMSQMIIFHGWRMGYATILVLQFVIVGFVVVLIFKGLLATEKTEAAQEDDAPRDGKFLTKVRYQHIQWVVFFLYIAVEYSVTFWTVSVLVEGRGLDISVAGLYPAVYLGAMMVGRLIFGYATDKFSGINVIRAGLVVAIAGLFVLAFSDNIIGMALIGFGFAPVFPCLMHETKRRFDPTLLMKLVGNQVAATGFGVGLSAIAIGQVLSRVSLELLFPILIGGIMATFVLNEVIEFAQRRVK